MSEAKKPPTGRPFQVGQSGNPGGRPSTALTREILEQYRYDAYRCLINCMRLPVSTHGGIAISATKEWFDRVEGKVAANVEVNNGTGNLLMQHLLAVRAGAEAVLPAELAAAVEAETRPQAPPDWQQLPRPNHTPPEVLGLALWEATSEPAPEEPVPEGAGTIEALPRPPGSPETLEEALRPMEGHPEAHGAMMARLQALEANNPPTPPPPKPVQYATGTDEILAQMAAQGLLPPEPHGGGS